MIRPLVLTAFLAAVLSSGVTAAENPFIGHWTSGDLASCAPGYAADVLSIKIDERQIEMFEQGCDIKSMRKISKLADSGYRLRLLCHTPSAKRFSEIQLTLVGKSPLHGPMLVYSDASTGIVTTYQRCP